ncbi:MAG: hypothetical protein AB7M05_10270 [Alphaproteobacteria bacterium]
MTSIRRHAVLRGGIVVVASGLLLAACGNKDESKAYDACLAIGKDRYPAAKFESKSKAAITKASDTSYTVRIPYVLDNTPGTLECALTKQSDGNFANAAPPVDTTTPAPATTGTTTPPATDATPATPPASDTTTPAPAPVPGTPAPSDTTTKP